VIYFVILLALFFSRGSRSGLRRADRMTRMSAACGTMQRGRCAPAQWNRRYPGFSLFSSSRAPSFCRSLTSFFHRVSSLHSRVLSFFRASITRSLFSLSLFPFSLFSFYRFFLTLARVYPRKLTNSATDFYYREIRLSGLTSSDIIDSRRQQFQI